MSYMLQMLTFHTREAYFSYAQEKSSNSWKDPEAVMHWAEVAVLRDNCHWLAKKIIIEGIQVKDISVDIFARGLSKSEAEAAKMANINFANRERYTILNRKKGMNSGAPLRKHKTYSFGYRIYGEYIYCFYHETDQPFYENRLNTAEEMIAWASLPSNSDRVQGKHIREYVVITTDVRPIVFTDTELTEVQARNMKRAFRAYEWQLGRQVIK